MRSTRAASAEETTLVFATTLPPNAHLSVEFFRPWTQRVNEEGQGVIKVDVADGSDLADHLNYYNRVLADVVQLAWGLQSYSGGKFPRSAVAGLPVIADKAEHAAVALLRLYESGALDAEYDEIVPIMLTAHSHTGIHLSRPLRSPDDLGGIRVIVPSKITSKVVSMLGATPVSIPLSEMYEAIQRGTVDGAVVGWAAFQPFKLAEVTTYHIDTELGASPGMVFMSKKKYEALPVAARRIIDANAGEAESRRFGAFWDEAKALGRKETVASPDKHTVVDLSPAAAEKWRQKITPAIDDWARSTPDGEKTLQDFRAILAQVKAGA